MSSTCLLFVQKAWNTKTKQAQQALQKGATSEALYLHLEAMIRAEVLQQNLLKCICNGIPICKCYTQTCIDLANTYQMLKDKKNAERHLQKAKYYLNLLSSNLSQNLSVKLQINELKKDVESAYIYITKDKQVI
ncbi:hypothetical protein [Myroides injenensis]|uniref:hypothetical protein n=1 Tax=Myroides injenensis TaxID=1183151 RepID=UPI0002899418|nr:hypothetical protein [Myroides injenensis]